MVCADHIRHYRYIMIYCQRQFYLKTDYCCFSFLFPLAVVIGFEMTTYRINEPDIVGFTDLEVCMRLTVGALGMDLTLLVEWVQGRATGELNDNPFN